jgi:Domain of unknown function (DUF4156)
MTTRGFSRLPIFVSFRLLAGIAGSVAFLDGCNSHLQEHVDLLPAAENVEIAVDPPSANSYQLVGKVTGEAAANDADSAQAAAKNDLRNKAAALGASLVTIDENTGEAIPLEDKTRVKLVGRAYKSID